MNIKEPDDDYGSASIFDLTRWDVASRLFVSTADENYVLARTAFWFGSGFDFYWLSSQAIGKYLKAILLMNGCTSKRYRHELTKLYAAASSLDERVDFCSFMRPLMIGDGWYQHSNPEFLERLEHLGSSDNRYGIYGFDQQIDDLVKIDQLVWQIRRYCRPFKARLWQADGTINDVDQLTQLVVGAIDWRLGGFLPLEELLHQENKSETKKRLFLHRNSAFGLAESMPSEPIFKLSATNSPFFTIDERLSSPQIDRHEREELVDALEWCLENISSRGRDAEGLRQQIARSRRP